MLRVRHPVERGIDILLVWKRRNILVKLCLRFGPIAVSDEVACAAKDSRGFACGLRRKAVAGTRTGSGTSAGTSTSTCSLLGGSNAARCHQSKHTEEQRDALCCCD